ncbi:Nramp family divalent metal transporter [Gordonia sp. X0973]|uniref:Nramp family divalent metal transporter n=1 Tax=Gordonia sp. X0973 TaxID=2742602 RepID=UPI000F53719D|nr:Nramp family divalent metal transporter [Gordonia sp. X0973]QKT07345.1 Nramp family divalent metal transporter [Gordonia sp. X0973]
MGVTTELTVGELRSTGRRRSMLLMLGPAFVAAVAYIDPGNFATNFAAGSGYGYQLVWVVVMANVMAMLVQYLSAKLGLATGLNLPELCRREYGRRTNVMLWVQAEIVAMATDLAEFVGAAIALNLLFGMPMLPAGIVTAVLSFAILALRNRGFRAFELAIIALLGLVAAGFGYLVIRAGDYPPRELMHGLIPDLSGAGAPALAVGIIGATVMPHVVYLHSALHQNRISADTDADRQTLLRYNRADCLIGLGVAGLINLAMLAIAASLFHRGGGSEVSDLQQVHHELGTLLGGGAALAFAVALLASGLSSSSVGTQSGQVVMSGFMRLRLPVYLRRAITMAPALLLLALGIDTTQALIFSQIVLSFGIPFALVPLLLLSRRRDVMGALANRPLTTVAMAVVTTVIIVLNVYLLADTIAGWIT